MKVIRQTQIFLQKGKKGSLRLEKERRINDDTLETSTASIIFIARKTMKGFRFIKACSKRLPSFAPANFHVILAKLFSKKMSFLKIQTRHIKYTLKVCVVTPGSAIHHSLISPPSRHKIRHTM